MKELKLTNKSINDVWVKRKVVKDSLRINRLVVMSDADTDGDAICGLILNLINEFWPEMFEQCRVSRVQTPIQIARPKNKRGKEKIFYFLNDIKDWESSVDVKDYNIEYYKGLAALNDNEYKKIIQDPFEVFFVPDAQYKNKIKTWFTDDSEGRKSEIQNMDNLRSNIIIN